MDHAITYKILHGERLKRQREDSRMQEEDQWRLTRTVRYDRSSWCIKVNNTYILPNFIRFKDEWHLNEGLTTVASWRYFTTLNIFYNHELLNSHKILYNHKHLYKTVCIKIAWWHRLFYFVIITYFFLNEWHNQISKTQLK